MNKSVEYFFHFFLFYVNDVDEKNISHLYSVYIVKLFAQSLQPTIIISEIFDMKLIPDLTVKIKRPPDLRVSHNIGNISVVLGLN